MRRQLTSVLCITLMLGTAVWAQSARDRNIEPQRVLDSLQVRPGMVVGEVGAGRGYFTMKLARRVGPAGRVIANDIDKSSLKTLERAASAEGLENIDVLLGGEADPKFKPQSLDLAVMVYVFHDLTRPVALMRQLKEALKPGAVVAILDRDPERYAYDSNHFMKRKAILGKLDEAGFDVETVWTFLRRDNIYMARPRTLPQHE